MKTLAELEALELAIHNRKEGQSIASAVEAFEKSPKFPPPKPLVENTEDTSFQYCEAIRRFLLNREDPLWIDEQTMGSIMGAKRIIVPWGKAPEGWPHI